MDEPLYLALGDVVLQSGEVLKSAQLAYKVYGTLNSTGTNAILYPTHYGGTHRSNEPMIGEGRALDPTKYFIIVPNMFGKY
jgi:homoserine O-acetyltransferase